MPIGLRRVKLGFTTELYPEGTHICYLYDDDEERRRFVHAYVSSGIAEEESVDYLADVSSKEELGLAADKMGLRNIPSTRERQLVFNTATSTYCTQGRFIPEVMLDRLGQMYDRGHACRYAGSRMSGEMSWAARDLPDSDRLVEYEARVNDFVKLVPLTAMCQYDTRKFDGGTIFEILNVHSLIIVCGQVIRNPFYAGPTGSPLSDMPLDVYDGHTPSPDVLGRLLVIQHVLDALSNPERMAQFARRALMSIPGVIEAHVHMHAHPLPLSPDMEELYHMGVQALDASTSMNFVIGRDGIAVHFYPLRTVANTFGLVILRIADESLSRPYLDFIGNLSHMMAMTLQTRQHQEELRIANEELRAARDHLEERVARRTQAILTKVDEIRDAASRIVEGDLSRRLSPAGGGKELEMLVHTVNRMLDQIDNLMQAVRHTSNAIAHDLRTPLTELRLRLEELLKTRPPQTTTFAAIDNAVADLDRTLAIFNALLRLAEIDTGRRRAGFVEVDVSALVDEVAEFYRPLAELKGIELSVRLGQHLVTLGDPAMLAQAIGNLIDNALKYAPSGSLVVAETSRASAQAIEIVVADNGPGIPDEEKPRAVERFYRGENPSGAPGVGLGLTLVAAVARLHDGALVLSDNHPGLRASVSVKARRDDR